MITVRTLKEYPTGQQLLNLIDKNVADHGKHTKVLPKVNKGLMRMLLNSEVQNAARN